MGFRGQAFAFDSPAAAIAAMIAHACPPPAHQPCEAVGLDGAAGRILAQDVHADRDSPAFDYSAMDGYAARGADLAALGTGPSPTGPSFTFPVVAESRIGEPPPTTLEGHQSPAAVRIATGAAIPAGADTVLRREDVIEHASGPAGEVTSISVTPQVAARAKRGDNIRRRGENARAGAVVLRAGEALSAASLATLAAVGITRPTVFPPLRVAIITTGDELVEPDRTPSAFQIRNSNAPAVRAVLASHSWMEVASVLHIRDDDDLGGVLDDARQHFDAVVLTGGVSMGHRDPVRAALEQAGAEIVFHGLPQRPGKPMLGAILRRSEQRTGGSVPIFGLPGNPVSALVTCVRIVVPVFAACAGAKRTPQACLPRLIELRNPDGRTLDLWWHRPVRLIDTADGPPQAELIDTRGSGDIIATGMSDGFIELSPAASHTILPYYSWPYGACGPIIGTEATR